MGVLAAWQVGEVVWTMVWLTVFVVFVYLVICVTVDVFRDDDLSGLAKAVWILTVIAFPYLGVFLYLIVRGSSMGARTYAARERRARRGRRPPKPFFPPPPAAT